MPEFTETFGIALTESMLSGGGPVITTDVGGIGEAVGDTALVVPPADPVALAAALDHAVLGMSAAERDALAARASDHTRQFDRTAVLDTILGLVSEVDVARAARV